MADLASKSTVEDIKLEGQRVLVRVDFNVPIKNEKVGDPRRIVEAIPTLKYILSRKPKSLVIMSHLGRPDGRPQAKYSLKPILPVLEKHLGTPVKFLSDCVGQEVEEACKNPAPGTVFLLENLRFHLEEEGKGVDKDKKKVKASKEDIATFRKSLSSLGDVYVNDAFGTAHRAHSSMVGINLPVRASGYLMAKELKAFSSILHDPPKPFLAILGGAKVEDKLPLIMNLLDKVTEMIIGGGMAFTFLKVAHGVSIGKSLFDQKGADLIPKIIEKAKEKKVKLHFPVDFKCGQKFAADTETAFYTVEQGIPEGWMGLDIGPKTQVEFARVIWRAKAVLLNGPLGAFELAPFSIGTLVALHALAAVTQYGVITIIGGGDSAAAAASFGLDLYVKHVSTGGGASLELLEGKTLPGISVLSSKAPKAKL